MDCSAAALAFIVARVATKHQDISKHNHTSSLPAVRARPANAKTVALIEMLIPTSTAPKSQS